MAVVVKTVLGSYFGGLVNSPPILEPVLVGIGMFTGVRFGFWPHCSLRMAAKLLCAGREWLLGFFGCFSGVVCQVLAIWKRARYPPEVETGSNVSDLHDCAEHENSTCWKYWHTVPWFSFHVGLYMGVERKKV